MPYGYKVYCIQRYAMSEYLISKSLKYQSLKSCRMRWKSFSFVHYSFECLAPVRFFKSSHLINNFSSYCFCGNMHSNIANPLDNYWSLGLWKSGRHQFYLHKLDRVGLCRVEFAYSANCTVWTISRAKLFQR